jgi:FtsP/CotA-like multicopper oxidase with cupredoxin domain
MRPDLVDAHTLHWHGFRDAIPFFDGEPHGSVSVPIGREFIYVYNAHEPGTYMYHCHVEDVEHVHMGMTGLVFVRPAQDGNTSLYPSGKYAYNDGDGSTGYDREYAMFLSENWAEAHWADSHIQLPEWSDYHPDFSLLNGRVYPDTLAPNGSVDPFNPVRQSSGDLIAVPGYEHLQYQPYSSLVQCNAGDRVLLRFAQLGFKQASMTLAGIKMRAVGKDATHLRGRDGTDFGFETNTVNLGAGESVDAIFTAPAYKGPGPYDTYLLYNRAYNRSSNLSGGYGGQMTEVRVYPAGTLVAQTLPNT